MINTVLKKGNAKQFIIKVPEHSTDLILTDPPYDMKTANIKTPPLTYGEKMIYANNFKRILKRTGNLIIFVGLRDKFRWNKVLQERGFMLMSEVIIVYGGGIKSDKHFLPAHESALHYVLSKDYYFEEGELFPDVYKTQRPRGITRNWGYDYGTAPSEKLNVTPKPLGLVQKLIEILSPEGGVVRDPFMGSGTTGEGCVVTGRNFYGYEIDRVIFEFAVGRIEEAKQRTGGREKWW